MTDLGIGILLFLIVTLYTFMVITNRKKIKKLIPNYHTKNQETHMRPLAWVIIVFNLYWVYRLFKGLYQIGLSGQSDGLTGASGIFFILLWLLVLTSVNVVLYIIYRITDKKKRSCPACGVEVQVGRTICPKCNFDFAKAAGA